MADGNGGQQSDGDSNEILSELRQVDADISRLDEDSEAALDDVDDDLRVGMSGEVPAVVDSARRSIELATRELRSTLARWRQLLESGVPVSEVAAAIAAHGAAPRSPVPRIEQSPELRRHFAERGVPMPGTRLEGLNSNTVTTNTAEFVVREPITADADFLPDIAPKVFNGRPELLRAIGSSVPVPEVVLSASGQRQILRFIPGVQGAIGGDPVRITGVAALLAKVGRVPLDVLPAFPQDWPTTPTDSVMKRINLMGAYWTSIHSDETYSVTIETYEKLGFPADFPFDRLLENVADAGLSARVPGLTHGDPHGGNVIWTLNGPVMIDWDQACPGDPLWDVAYLRTIENFSDEDSELLIRRWVERVGEERSYGYANDLPVLGDVCAARFAIVGTPSQVATIQRRVRRGDGPQSVAAFVELMAPKMAGRNRAINSRLGTRTETDRGVIGAVLHEVARREAA